MALRNQPYLPLYVQDYLTDEKLNLCSAASQGVYIKILCIMHKSAPYGVILLKQKDKQNGKQINNFCYKLAKLLPFTEDIIKTALTELLDEGVLFIEGDGLCQKRMIKDEKISLLRSEAGSKGGFAKAKGIAKKVANTEYEDENVIDNKYPSKEDVVLYFIESGHPKEMGESFWSYYDAQDWKTTKGASIKKRWQSKVIGWLNNQKEFNKNAINKGNKPRGSIDFNKYESELATIKPRST